MSETVAFTHPTVVLKSGLKNNWMKKLDRVNRPLKGLANFIPYETCNCIQEHWNWPYSGPSEAFW